MRVVAEDEGVTVQCRRGRAMARSVAGVIRRVVQVAWERGGNSKKWRRAIYHRLYVYLEAWLIIATTFMN
ncbi:hypothetical protein Pcinc_011908 [Petrolisthes cinctipes]|uniref:Uncharacterized protein n=1 Tax=Petrolisthes cinctipes TaxID=88211 RepID=A0AAE1FZX3_PETCI|nr:hypothetical protein Pcinc_011908 [Petrolisthes cinctipes]